MCGGAKGHDAGDAAAKARSAELDAMLKSDARAKKNEVKLLLLGAGESGKSTLVKQMRIIHHGKDAFPPDEREDYKDVIMSNTVQSIRVVLEAMPSFDLDPRTPDAVHAAEIIGRLDDDTVQDKGGRMRPDVVQAVKTLWADPAVRQCIEYSAQFQLNDSATYFFDEIDRIGSQQGYVPNDQDILRARVKTTGISEYFFKVGQMTYRMMDVGGQRSEEVGVMLRGCQLGHLPCVILHIRAQFKWTVAALSEYDQVLYEDETTNRMSEALVLFDSIANSRWFRTASIILFLNKVDIFRAKVKVSPLDQHFPDFTGGQDPRLAGEFLRGKFLERNMNKDHEIYTHYTCSVDTSQVKVVMEATTGTKQSC